MKKSRNNYLAWKGLQTVRVLPSGSQETITYEVYVNWDRLDKLAQKAADNRSASSKMGPVLVNITKAVTDRKKETV